MKRLTVLALLFTFASPAALAEEVYRKQSSWAETMTATRRAVLDQPNPDAFIENLCRKFWDDFPETDWFMQDAPGRLHNGGINLSGASLRSA